MNLATICRVARWALALTTIGTAPLAAQNLLLTDYKGKLLPVVRAQGSHPYVLVGGKQVEAEGRSYILQKFDEYMPVFISVGDLDVNTFSPKLNGSDLNHEFQLRASLVTPYQLDDVFVGLDLSTKSSGKLLLLYEVGRMDPREPRWISLHVPVTSDPGPGRYELHVFSKGMEVLNSTIDPGSREAVLDRMTQTRIASVKDQAPKLFIGPPPEYPPALFRARTSGQVVVSIRIGTNGRVYDPVLQSASDPAFGQAALDAVKSWRFLPKVRDGIPVEAHADMPIGFEPPSDRAGRP